MAGSRQGLLLFAILTGTFLVPVNSTMIAVGLPSIADSLQSDLIHASWVVTIYLIVMTTFQPIAGKLGDLYGNRQTFLLGLLLFLIASLGCIAADGLLGLSVFRALQALGGALASPNASAILRFAIPKEQMGRTFGLFGLSMGLGAAIDPLIGSFLISAWGWTSIFWINIPFASLSFVLSFLVLPKRESRPASAVDVPGSILLAIGLVTLILLSTHAEYANVWTSGLLLLVILLFVLQERRCKVPLIQFELFRIRMFTSANLSILLANAIMYSTILVMPILLQRDLHLPIETIGWLLFAFSLCMSLCSWVGGYLSDRIGRDKTVLFSFLISGLAAAAYLGIYPYHSVSYLCLVFIIGGIGSGIGTAAMQTASLQAVAKELAGIASGIFLTFRYIGGMIASVLVSLLVDYRLLFYMLIGFAILGIPVSLGLLDPTGRQVRREGQDIGG
ncbi:MFS transporter [Brevibacillus massiliensis]|uniref:MFS transporter n=1 Tax=Brevibacillus massiliensis TaxID=1118054 RepID=UPI00037E6700|nr:MFS transporter [Brevibacillus massiliensis]